ncbi:MAG: 5-oxoprolinase subunit PxpA [Propionibacteriaceae bacterium]|nr:5-oxoprolinase subunit PxpA [Propionibacteriaceae bacterium]
MDLNADLGESFGRWSLGDDAAMLDVVTSANIACGFHAGDPLTLRTTTQGAAQRGVAIGAHVSYRDLAGFGRRFIDVSVPELVADTLYQLGAVDGVSRASGTRVRYVKPHGALYNAAVHHEGHAKALVEAIVAFDDTLPVLGLPGSLLLRLAEEAGLPTVTEAFADRGYLPDGTLVPRTEPGAIVHDGVAERMVRLAVDGEIEAVDGTVITLRADSICTHGDTPGAVELARSVRAALSEAGVEIAPFVP